MRILINTILYLLITTAAWASSPAIFYSDLTAGPNTGGQNNYGVFVTIWGNNFGSSQGTSYITVGGGKVNNYPTWTNTMITFQLGPNAATGNIVLASSNGNATGPAFTVQAGNIYFVQPGASTNGTGTYASPFSHLYYAENISNPGDTIYVLAGTIYDESNGHLGWHSLLIPDRSGTQGSPISYIAYPNATVILKADGATDLYANGGATDGDVVQYIFRAYANWITVAKFTLQMTGTSNMAEAIDGNGDGWKVVGNNITALAFDYAIVETGSNYAQVLGNEIHDSGTGQTFNNENHSIYWDYGGNPVEIGWNYLHGNNNAGWEISCFHQGSSAEPTRVGKIHDNVISNPNGYSVKGILLGDVDSGEDETTVEGQNISVYNNVFYNVGENNNGGAIQAVSGTAYIFNNTIYQNPDSKGTIQFPVGGIGPGGGHPVWYVANNIIYNSISSALYLSDGNGNAPTWTNFALLTNNNYYGSGNGPTQDPHPVNANPLFVSAGTNFQLQASSPDINAGYNTTGTVIQDIFGLVRSSTPTIGAYEYTGSTQTSPVVAITSPASGSSVTSGSNISITATASETNGSITNISLYNGATLLGSSSSSPYTFVMNNPAVGNYTLTAVATDAKGVSTTSSAVSVTVTSQTLPSSPVVNITNPANGGSYAAGSNVTITTTASESNGTIKNISLYNGSGLFLGSSSSSPYSYVDTNMAAGGYSFYAVATDVNGVSTTSSTVTITVSAPSTPAVIITSPTNGTTFLQNSTFTITANASETNGTIAQVQYYSGSYLLATATSAPYTASWLNATTGTFYVTAKATDTNGVSTMSSPITITVTSSSSSNSTTTTYSPVVSITSPANGSSFTAGSTITLNASASETNGTIAQVQFYNGSSLLGTDTSSPYSFTWGNVPAGTYSITAKATDANGVSTTSGAITVSVTSPSSPTVSITSPANGSSYTAGSNLSITANASETNGTISQLQFYNGSTLLGTDTSSPYSYAWNNIAAGNYTITAKATDANGVSTMSGAITISVTSPSSPTVSITSPANGSSYKVGTTFTITSSASETNGTIAQVQYYSGTSLLATASSSPFTASWTNSSPGTFSITAKAIDTKGVSTISNPITITVTAIPSSPVVSITSPVNGSSLTTGSNLTISASASETNGTISAVYFYNGTTFLGSDTASPYNFTLSNIAAGTYNLIAVAIDANGVSASSSVVSVTVYTPSVPVVSITSPVGGTKYSIGSPININIAASETNGTLTQVRIFNGSMVIYTFYGNGPYSFSWTPQLLPGTYNLSAQATDINGVTTTSSTVAVTISLP